MTLAVVDTNIVVAGLLTADPETPVARILDGMISGRIAFAVSIELMSEYRAVLLRPRIRERHGLSEAGIDHLLAALAINARIIEPAPAATASAPDTGDTHLWALLAAVGEDALLVTGDRLLHRHPPPGGVPVDSAGTFIERIGRRHGG